MNTISSAIVLLSGFLAILSPPGLAVLIASIVLSYLGARTKRRFYIYFSLLFLLFILFANINLVFITPVGAVLGSLISLNETTPQFFNFLLYNLGFILVPLIVNLFGLFLVSRKKIS